MTRQGFSLHGFAAALAAAIFAVGCAGSDGAQGPQGPQGTQGPAGADATAYGTLAGTVKDAFGNVVAGATVSVPVTNDTAITTATAADGSFSVAIPTGARTATFSASGYVSFSLTVDPKPAKTTTVNVLLNPASGARFSVNVAAAAVSSAKGAGSTWKLTPTVNVFDPALKGQPVTYAWALVSGPTPAWDSQTNSTTAITLASSAAFKARIAQIAAPNFKPNPDEGTPVVDRYQVLPVSYEQANSQGNATKVKVTVTIGGVSYDGNATVTATLPFKQSTGLANVPVNTPVILQGQFPFTPVPKASWSWTVTGPDGAPIAVNDAATPYPDFVPTTAGSYLVSEGGTPNVLKVIAGTYQGVMTGPGAATGCACHASSGIVATWMGTGHKEVIWAGIEEARPGGHYASTCTPCHTAGNGLTGAGGYADKIASPYPAPDFATTLQGNVLAEQLYWQLYPAGAPLTGVQCENCHGPQASDGHTLADAGVGTIRISYSSNLCATCHARAPTHGRFPQWNTSAHASYATFTFNAAADGSLANTCACCHSAQGFAAYRAILPTANGDRSKTVLPAGLSVSNAQPITCQTCHVAHDEGDAGQVEWTNLAKVGPTEGSTYMLPSGFAADGVGKGALCIACHNSRQGYSSSGLVGPYLHEDGDPKFGTLTSYGAPHEACQGDVLLGRNGYWLGAQYTGSPSTRSKHSYIGDTCVTCHMALTDPHPTLGSAGQMRHDFVATPGVCNKCHTSYSTESVQAAFSDRYEDLRTAVGTAILNLKFNGAIPTGTTAKLVANRSGQVDVTDATGPHRWFISTRNAQDAFVWDPNYPATTQAVSGCTPPALSADGLWVANCTGYLAGAPGYTGANLDPALSATSVSATGFNASVAKGLWNAVLVQDDASKGVHNPAFTFEILDRTIQNVGVFAK
jgi:hypothetical protein